MYIDFKVLVYDNTGVYVQFVNVVIVSRSSYIKLLLSYTNYAASVS